MLSCHKWRCRVEIRWCMTRWTLWQASPAGGGEPPWWESIRIIVPRRAAALWALQMLSAQLPDLLYVRYAPYMLLLYTPYTLLKTRVRCRRNNSWPHARRFCLSRVVLVYWTISSTSHGSWRPGPCGIPGSQDFFKILIPGFSKSDPGIFRDFQKPLNNCILRLSTPFVDHNNLSWDL